MNTQQASKIMSAAYASVFHRPITKGELLLLLSQARMESAYGTASPGGECSGVAMKNWGMVQTRSTGPGTCAGVDSQATGARYRTRFKVYPSHLAGAADQIRNVQNITRGKALVAARQGSLPGYALALTDERDGGMYTEGHARDPYAGERSNVEPIPGVEVTHKGGPWKGSKGRFAYLRRTHSKRARFVQYAIERNLRAVERDLQTTLQSSAPSTSADAFEPMIPWAVAGVAVGAVGVLWLATKGR